MSEEGFELVLEKPHYRSCCTYFDVAKCISEVTHPVGSKEWFESIEPMIKRYGHQEKLNVWIDVKHWHETGDFFNKLIEGKIETHKSFASKPDDEMIYGRGKWVKND